LRERGFALHAGGDLAAAEQAYREVLRRSPQDLDVMHAFGALAVQAAQYASAVNLLTTVVGLRPTAGSFADLGNALLATGKCAEALANYDRALELEPEYVPAHINRAQALRGLGQRDALCSQYSMLRPHFDVLGWQSAVIALVHLEVGVLEVAGEAGRVE